jgi:hypothetical protein
LSENDVGHMRNEFGHDNKIKVQPLFWRCSYSGKSIGVIKEKVVNMYTHKFTIFLCPSISIFHVHKSVHHRLQVFNLRSQAYERDHADLDIVF